MNVLKWLRLGNRLAQNKGQSALHEKRYTTVKKQALLNDVSNVNETKRWR